MTDTETHTVDEALDRFNLINGAGRPDENTACAMTALAWIAGEAWSDHPACANRVLANNVILANDAPGTTPEQRAELVRAGETGVIDTWWVPDTVVVSALRVEKDEEVAFYDRVLRAVNRVGEWKESRERPVLSDAVLSGAVLRGAVLRGAVLSDADLSDADLSGADLSGAVLSGAVLSGADLRGADLRGAVLSAVLRGAVLSGADLRGADLSGADLRGAVLSDADLSDADLRGADLRGAVLSAVLRGAVLSGAVLRGAVLSDADLRDADLRGADLRGADLSDAWGTKWTASTMPPGSGWTYNGETLRFERATAG